MSEEKRRTYGSICELSLLWHLAHGVFQVGQSKNRASSGSIARKLDSRTLSCKAPSRHRWQDVRNDHPDHVMSCTAATRACGRARALVGTSCKREHHLLAVDITSTWPHGNLAGARRQSNAQAEV